MVGGWLPMNVVISKRYTSLLHYNMIYIIIKITKNNNNTSPLSQSAYRYVSMHGVCHAAHIKPTQFEDPQIEWFIPKQDMFNTCIDCSSNRMECYVCTVCVGQCHQPGHAVLPLMNSSSRCNCSEIRPCQCGPKPLSSSPLVAFGEIPNFNTDVV